MMSGTIPDSVNGIFSTGHFWLECKAKSRFSSFSVVISRCTGYQKIFRVVNFSCVIFSCNNTSNFHGLGYPQKILMSGNEIRSMKTKVWKELLEPWRTCLFQREHWHCNACMATVCFSLLMVHLRCFR